MKVDPNTVDYFGRAMRQGASRYVARRFEIYAYCCLDSGVKPVPCKRFLDLLDWVGIETAVEQLHSTSAGALLSACRRMASPGTF